MVGRIITGLPTTELRSLSSLTRFEKASLEELKTLVTPSFTV